MDRRLSAIFAADIVGYSRLMEQDEVGTLTALQLLHSDVIEPFLAGHHGRIVKLMGDGVLAEFASVVDAVTCASAVQAGISERNDTNAFGKAIHMRIGIHLGDVIVENNDIFGDGVNVAARLEGLAKPGGICISQQAYDQVETKLDLRIETLGEQRLKNIERPVVAFHVPPSSDPSEIKRAEAPSTPGSLPAPEKPSVVVLPFDNMSDNPEQEYFCDGISEDIITDLSKVSALFVIARNSAFVYKDRPVQVQEVSRQLGVRHVVEGSVRRAGDRLRITAQLIDGETGGHLWAERYDRDITDIFALQDEITGKIVEALKIELTQHEQDHVTRRYTDNLEAYEHFLLGRNQVRTTNTTNAEAREMFDRAIDLDPHFAAAHALRSYCHWRDWFNQWDDDPHSLDKAFQSASRSVSLDGSLPLGRAHLGWAYLWKRDQSRAISEARQAVSLNPNFAEGHARLGEILNSSGQPEEGVECIQTAMRLDPHFPSNYLIYLGHGHYMMGRYEEAIDTLKRSLIRTPHYLSPRRTLAVILSELGRTEDAKAEVAEMLKINPKASVTSQIERMPFVDTALSQRQSECLLSAGLPG